MSKDVILTGLRANNELHIGNYFGALLPIVDMAKNKSDEYQVNLFIPDLHSFTTPIDHSKLQEQIKQNIRVFVACGLPIDNPNVHIYRQSYVPAHSELTWILECFTDVGEMTRMTQFKQKINYPNGLSFVADEQPTQAKLMMIIQAENHQLKAQLGLLNYPVLMAADILLYRAKYVPVGDDQTQHLEFTRDIAERMNNKFGELFVVPKPVKKQHEFFGKDRGLRIKDLQDPTKKMSKSNDSEKGIIFMTDSPEAAKKKIMSAETDSLAKVTYDPENQPGISNLLQIYALLDDTSIKEAEDKFAGQTKYGEFKKIVADKTAEFLNDFQTKLSKVNDELIYAKLSESEAKMNEQANATLIRVQKAVGLR